MGERPHRRNTRPLALLPLILSSRSNILLTRLKATRVASLIITKSTGNTQRPGLTPCGNNRTPARRVGRLPLHVYISIGGLWQGNPKAHPLHIAPVCQPYYVPTHPF